MNQPSVGFPHSTKHTGTLSELTEMPIEAVHQRAESRACNGTEGLQPGTGPALPPPTPFAWPGKLAVGCWLCFLRKQPVHLRKNKEQLVKGAKQKAQDKTNNENVTWLKRRLPSSLGNLAEKQLCSLRCLSSVRLQVLKSVRGKLCT